VGAGYAGSVSAVGGTQLGDDFGEVVAYRAFGEAEFGGDLGGAATIASELEDSAFAVGEWIGIGSPGFGGKCGIHGAETGVDAANGFG
jgi:hypothetical protein